VVVNRKPTEGIVRFTKMHGLGNDYVYIDAIVEPELEHKNWPELSIAMSDRHTGIGADGVILICQPRDTAHHARMRTFNADGSEAGACGNGTRCVARYLRERLGMTDTVLGVESGGRVLESEPLGDSTVRVAMGTPSPMPRECHIDPQHLASAAPLSIDLAGHRVRFAAVSVGNPHAVVFTHDNPWLGEDLAAECLRLGPIFEHHRAFTQRINAHLVRIGSRDHATIHTWERGAGPTQACGTGACATHVAGVRAGLLNDEAAMSLPGGDLRISWTPPERGGDGIVRQTGPAEFVFDGHWIGPTEGITV
jgi:diaminopimelate epimerase